MKGIRGSWARGASIEEGEEMWVLIARVERPLKQVVATEYSLKRIGSCEWCRESGSNGRGVGERAK